jgi:signal transduction histidine kinase
VRELSLHILDLVENSIRAGANTIRVVLWASESGDRLHLAVHDDGPGLPVPPEVALDPFYTTSPSKKVGLGLSLLSAVVQRAGGVLSLGRSELGGLAVQADMQLSHIDRSPIGDLAATMASVVCANPQVDLQLDVACGHERHEIDVRDLARQSGYPSRVALARRVMQRVGQCVGHMQ